MKKLISTLLFFACVLSLSAQYQRRVLVEEFTNASCPPCAAQNPAFNQLLEDNAVKVTPIKYQTDWPGVDPMNAQNPTEVDQRVTYYGVTGVPNGFVDGQGIVNDCGYYANAPACLNATEIDALYGTTSPVKIELTHSFTADFDSIIVNVAVTSATALTGQLRLHVAVVEEDIIFANQPGSNGELDFYQVMRKMLPSAAGTTTGDFTAGETKTYTLGWPVLYCYDLNQIGASAWLQNNTGKVVYNSAKSLPAGGFDTDSGIGLVASMPSFTCAAGTTPFFTIQNNSGSTMTSASILYSFNGGLWTPYNWTGSLAPGASEQVTLTGVTITANSSLNIVSMSSNIGATLDRTQGLNMNIKVLSPTPAALPFAAPFQSAAFPPATWNVQNAGTHGWKLATNAGANSTRSAKNDMFDYDAANTELISPKIDLTQSTGTTTLFFDHAYAYYSASFFDSLRVDISNDCGATWTTLFHDGKDGLSTAPATTAAFTPTAAQWENHSFDISSYNGSEVIVRFVAESGYGNNAYIDNVNISTAVGVKNLELTGFTVQPNPASDVAEVRFGLDKAQNVQLMVFDALGSLVQTRDLGQLTSGDHFVSLDAVRLTSGSYRVVLQGEAGVAQTQWVVVK
ncbi:MAG: Omp28-related outer membrane protein [Saprospiraceae bacterium]|nr:Omp28-related outer membrane protein [Saprospiraceae bacterium]